MITGVIMTITKPASYFINPKSLVCMDDLENILRVSRRTIYKLIKQTAFPKCLKLHNKRSRKHLWLYQDIIDFLNNVQNQKFIAYEQQKEKTFTRNFDWHPNAQQRKQLGIKEW